jgi:hypothetical protein
MILVVAFGRVSGLMNLARSFKAGTEKWVKSVSVASATVKSEFKRR